MSTVSCIEFATSSRSQQIITSNMASTPSTSKYALRLIFLLIFLLAIGHHFVDGQDLILQKCLPKADMENVTISCAINEKIALREAFFTSSMVDQCPFATSSFKYSANNITIGCTDDLRMTLNSKCSGMSYCTVNLREAHVDRCTGYDGWINIKYSCVSQSKMHSYCNLELTDNYGYVSNPGYPKFYPAYYCKWKIKAFPGQRVQIDFLDISLKEPRYTSKKIFAYECIDYVAIIENDAKAVSVCGESKSNLIEYRSKSNELIVTLASFDFSPTRGVLFKYTLLNCPTLRPPSNGHMFRNGSYAFYSCHFDFVFEDTGLQNRVLHCDYDTYWNGSVTLCVPKENATVKAFALTKPSENPIKINEDTQQQLVFNTQYENNSKKNDKPILNEGMITPIILATIVLFAMILLIGVLIYLKRKSSIKTYHV